MADSHDEVDDLLRGAMKVLDGEVPSGYFEALPNRTLARLEGNGMQTQSSGNNVGDTNPVVMQDIGQANDDFDRAPTTTDDSGLHDIRSLATSTKARLSKRMSAPVIDEDVLASSSAGWKAVALPEPAKMISLPELSELPNLAEVEASNKRSKRESKRGIVAAAPAPVAAAPVSTSSIDELASRRAEAAGAPATSMSSMPAFGSGMLAKQAPKSKSNKRGLLATASVGLAAAAGVLIYTQTAGKSSPSTAPAATEVAKEDKNAAAPTAEPLAQTAAPAAAEPTAGAAVAADTAAAPAPAPEEAAIAADEGAKTDDDRSEKRGASKKGIGKASKPTLEIDLSKGQKTPPPKAEDPKKPAAGEGGKKEEAVGSLDDLLKEAGVSDKKKVDAPKPEKKSLSSDDIRKGMQSVAGKAQACYAGTQGTASVKLTVAPTGKVQKVTVSGPFAGTPVGTCVSAAVQSITFPAWDGGPQSISYSYLLAE